MRTLKPFNLGVICRVSVLSRARRSASAEESFRTSRNVAIGMPGHTRTQFDSASPFITLCRDGELICGSVDDHAIESIVNKSTHGKVL